MDSPDTHTIHTAPLKFKRQKLALHIKIIRLKQNGVNSCLHWFGVVGSGVSNTFLYTSIRKESLTFFVPDSKLFTCGRFPWNNLAILLWPCAIYVVWIRRGQRIFNAAATFSMYATSSDKNTRSLLQATNDEKNHSQHEKRKTIRSV
jgi:hypothetical protein